MTGLHHITVNTTPGDTTVTVDGTPLTVEAVTIQAATGHIPHVLIRLPATGTIEVEGLLDIEQAATPGNLVRSIDPAELRRLDTETMTGRSLADDPYANLLNIVADLLDQTGEDKS